MDTPIGLSEKGLRVYWEEFDGIINRIDTNRVVPLKQAKICECKSENVRGKPEIEKENSDIGI